MLDAIVEAEAVLYRFNRLIRDLLRGTIKRNTFARWEIELLLDIDSCNLNGFNRREILRRYQRAVERELEKGAAAPMKLSEYLAHLEARRKRSGGNGSE